MSTATWTDATWTDATWPDPENAFAVAGPGTCPLVTKVHAEARRFGRDEGTVLFIGHAGHEETEGTVGEAPERATLVESVADAERVTVPDPSGVDLDWLAGARTIGVTAGASAPPALVDDLLDALGGLGPLTVTERSVATESVHFTLPKEVS